MATNFSKALEELSGSSGFMGSLLLFVIISLVAVLIFWASITELDNVTRGQGKIVSSIQIKSYNPLNWSYKGQVC